MLVKVLIRGHGREALDVCLQWAGPYRVASGDSSMLRRRAGLAPFAEVGTKLRDGVGEGRGRAEC